MSLSLIQFPVVPQQLYPREISVGIVLKRRRYFSDSFCLISQQPSDKSWQVRFWRDILWLMRNPIMPGSHVSCLRVQETFLHIPGDVHAPPTCWLYTNKISHSPHSSGRTFPCTCFSLPESGRLIGACTEHHEIPRRQHLRARASGKEDVEFTTLAS